MFRVVESRGVNKHHILAARGFGSNGGYFPYGTAQGMADFIKVFTISSLCHCLDELGERTGVRYTITSQWFLTVLFPDPVMPITLKKMNRRIFTHSGFILTVLWDLSLRALLDLQ